MEGFITTHSRVSCRRVRTTTVWGIFFNRHTELLFFLYHDSTVYQYGCALSGNPAQVYSPDRRTEPETGRQAQKQTASIAQVNDRDVDRILYSSNDQ